MVILLLSVSRVIFSEYCHRFLIKTMHLTLTNSPNHRVKNKRLYDAPTTRGWYLFRTVNLKAQKSVNGGIFSSITTVDVFCLNKVTKQVLTSYFLSVHLEAQKQKCVHKRRPQIFNSFTFYFTFVLGA